MFNLRLINQVRSQTPFNTPVKYIQDDMAIHDFDRAMANVSIGFAHDIMAEIIIWNIRVSMTKKGYAKITNERNHLVTPELLEKKWGIELEKEK